MTVNYTTAQREGILNGLPPFVAVPVVDFDDLDWEVQDAEGSTVARVNGGEEMALFFASELNRLASLPDGQEGK